MISPVMPTYARAPLAFEHGEGAWLTTTDGTRYLDFSAGIAVCALGHAHPALVSALETQARRLWHVSNLYEIPEQRALAERLVAETFADTAFFTNSGTEAVELAIKVVRRYWHAKGEPRETILAFEGSFHGRSTGAIAAAGGEKLTGGFGPLMPGFKHLPFGDHDALRAAFEAEPIAAVFLEPVQGEGGIRPVPPQCLRGLREMCDETGALLMLDEIQSGMGRTGALFAHEHTGIAPDLMTVAKGIGGGFPIGALLATEAAAEAMTPGTHGSTYGGNPLGCAVGLAVMDIIAEPDFLADVARKGARLSQMLGALADEQPDLIEGVRGLGLMRGLKLREGQAPGDFVAAARAAQLLLVPAGDNVVRLLPPLTVTDEEIAEACRRLEGACTRLKEAA